MTPEKCYQQCIHADCRATFGVDQVLVACPRCGDLLDVVYDWSKVAVPAKLAVFAARWASRDNPLDFSGVWRFRELLDFCDDRHRVTLGEGQTLLQRNDRLAPYVGVKPGGLYLQYEGLNPSGSFKDNGMAAAFSHARMVGATRVACASTGNTSASLALYAAHCGTRAVVFVGSGRIAFGKLAQALEYGARTLQIAGDFDACMRRVKEATARCGLYLVNSVNPFRLEGQKTIMYRVLEGLGWQVPDWVVAPGGNLGNSSAFGKAFAELKELGLIDRVPRLAVINATGADTLDRLVNEKKLTWNGGHYDRQAIADDWAWQDATGRRPHTIASAIEIARPVNAAKCLRALAVCDGVVRSVSDADILNARAQVGRCGLGCEPASAASVAGAKLLVAQGVIDPAARVVCVLTGHPLKDPDAAVGYHTGQYPKGKEVPGERLYANMPIPVADDIDAICAAVEREA
ncbi:MAG: threonine synthase [Phycisphaerae bacterium]|nr:threonine synthase [Phycisphaerae bacterium]